MSHEELAMRLAKLAIMKAQASALDQIAEKQAEMLHDLPRELLDACAAQIAEIRKKLKPTP